MAKPGTTAPINPQSQDLDIALAALYNSAQVIYYNFQFVFKFIGLMLIAFVMYKIGKFSVSEPIAQKVAKIQKQISKYLEQKQGLAARINRINSFYNKLIFVFLFIAIAAGALIYSQHLPFQLQITYLAPFFAIPLILYTAKLVHTSSLSTKSKKFVEMEHSLLAQTKQINKALGSKVQTHLRSLLCRDKINSKQNAPSHICSKKDCQQLRELLKAKYQITKNLAECALQFQWCSTCKNRKPFDELVRFQAKPMPPVRDGEVSEEQDADMKANYLLQTLEQIDKWVQDAGPCNCSKLYMQQILKNKKNSNRLLKQINTKLQQHQQKQKQHQATSTVIRTDSRISSTSNVSNISSNTQMSGMSASSGNARVYYVKKEE